MKFKSFPTGMPRIYTTEKILQMSRPLSWTSPKHNPFLGLIYGRFLAPPTIRYAVLPYRTRETKHLVFAICAACAEEKNVSRRCRHAEHERSFVASFTHFELNLALARGYKVMDVYEVWHWPEGQWVSDAQNNGLFSDYMSEFLRMKIESSGWPDTVTDEALRAEYVEKCFRDNGIRISEDAVALNPSKRYISKLLVRLLKSIFV